jgi:hypothetical protein
MASRQREHLLAVYASRRRAEAAARIARRTGAGPGDVRIGDALDRVVAVEAEMREEMEHTLAGPGNVGPWTKEMVKGMTLGTLLGAALGVVVTLPLAAFDLGMAWWTRLTLVVVVGAACGGTAGWVLGGGFGARRSDEPLAAEEGVTVAAPATPALERALARTRPIRLDVVASDGRPVRTVRTRPPEPIVRKLRRHAAEEERRT